MNQKALQTLEYDKIIRQLEEYATCPLGKELCRDLLPSSDLTEIKRTQQETTDAVSRVRMKGSISFTGCKDVGGSLKRLEIGSSLSIPEYHQGKSACRSFGKADGPLREDPSSGGSTDISPGTARR